MSRLLKLSLLLTLGCSPLTEENAPERAADAFCTRDRQCRTDAWSDSYNEDGELCRSQRADNFEDIFFLGAIVGLEPDLEEIDTCIRDIRRISCDDFASRRYGNNCTDILQ